MKHISTIAVSVAVFAAVATPALAGSTSMRKGAETVSINCLNSGCTISTFKNGAPAGTRTSAGGTANFNKLVASYKARGYR